MKATTRDIWESIKFALSIDTTVTEKDKKKKGAKKRRKQRKKEGKNEKRADGKKKKHETGTTVDRIYDWQGNKARASISSSRCASFLYFQACFFLIFSLTVRNDEKTSTRDRNRSSARIVISEIMSDANAPAAAHNHKMREKRNLMMMALRGWLYGFR